MEMNAFTYSAIAIILLLLELLYFKIARKYGIIDTPNFRSSHTRITLRGGGIIFYIGMLIWFILSKGAYPWFFAGVSIVSMLCLIDDIHQLAPSIRFPIQLISILIMFVQMGFMQPELWWFVPIALFFFAGVINVINFMDGINGMTAGYAFVALATLAYVNEHIIPFTDMRLIVIAMLSVAVFAIFNFRKKAVCFAGDVGSVSMAFLLMFLIGTLMWTTGDFSWITLLVVYGVDGVLTIFHRIMLKERITEAPRKHAYQLMANELHIPHTVVSVVYMVLQFIVNLCYLLHPGYMTLVAAVVVLSIAYIIFMKKYFHLHQLQ